MMEAAQNNTFFNWVSYIINNYAMWFVKGAGITLLVALSGTIIGFLIGLVIGILRTIKHGNDQRFTLKGGLLHVLNLILNVYIEVFRGTPMMVQAMVIYYGLSEALGIDLPALSAGILIVSINTGAYMAEIIRGGIQSIDKGQTEAARAIGMTHAQTMFSTILPQAIRNILPAIGNEFVINIKDTSVLNVISVVELYFQTKTVRGLTFRTYEVFLVTAAIYLFLTITITQLLRLLEKKLDGPDGYKIYSPSAVPNSQLNARGKGDI